MALSTKVLVAPAVLLILAGIWCGGGSRNDRIRRFSAFGISTIVVVALWFVAFRPSLVWEQSIRYHASTPRITSMSHNLATLTNTALHRDLLLVVALVLCLATGWHSRRHFTSRHRLFIRATTAWLVATVVLLVVQKATFRAHVSHLVVPVVVLCALLKPLRQIPASQRGRPTLRTFALGCAAFAILIAQFRGLLIPNEYSQPERSAVAVLRALPTSALVITDEPGLAWSAHKEMPAWLVDPGIKRFFGNDLRVGPRSVYASLADPRVCAVAVWTYRYGSLLPHLAEDLTQHGFVDRNTFGFWTSPDGSRGPRQVWIRPSCAATRVSSR